MQRTFGRLSLFSPAALLGCCLIALVSAFFIPLLPTAAATGPFADFTGNWTGTAPCGPAATPPNVSDASQATGRAAAPSMKSICNCAAPATAIISISAASSRPTSKTRSPDVDRAQPQCRRHGHRYCDGDRLDIHVESSGFSADLVIGDPQPAASSDDRFASRRTDREGVDFTQPELTGPPRARALELHWIGIMETRARYFLIGVLHAGLSLGRLRLCLLDQDARRFRRAGGL